LKKLIRFLKPYWIFAVLAPLVMVGEVLADLAQPKLMRKIVDDGILGNSFPTIIQTGLLMLGIVAVGGICGMACTAFSVKASQSFGNDLRREAFSRVMGLSLQQTDKFTTGSLVTRLTNDISATENFISMALRMFVRTIISFIGGIVMMLTLDVSFGVVLVCVLPIELVLMVIMIKKANPMFLKVQKKLDKVNSVVQENISGARAVKSFVRENYEIKRFDKANDELCGTNYSVAKLMALINPLMMIFMNVSVVAVVLIGGYQVEARQIQIGSVMAAITYITQILMSLLGVGMIFQQISRASASANRVAEILDEYPAVVGGEKVLDAVNGDLVFDNVSFSYPGAKGEPVLEGINLRIKKGETVAILGATGSGKTSLINLIPRFYMPTAGKITIGGTDISEYTLESLRSRVGCVLQKSELFSGTIADNIRWGNEKATFDDVVEASKIAQADEFIRTLNDGYDTVVSEKGASLSGGQKQRISIARALVKHPDILIFDDSTSALDLGTEARLQAALKEKLKGMTVIVIAQRVISVRGADKIAVLDNGKIAAYGKHDELMKTSELYRDIYASQQRGNEVANDA
jgi:ATP-binding cassette subfamily B multidrug efflux pump